MTPFPVEPARAQGPMRFVVSAYPSHAAALAAVEGALERRLAACASLVGADSRFWWDGRIQSAAETLVVFKTVPKRVGALCGYLQQQHPYDVPEIAEIDVPRADPGYVRYLERTLDRAALAVPGAVHPTRRAGPRAPAARRPGRTRGTHRRQ